MNPNIHRFIFTVIFMLTGYVSAQNADAPNTAAGSWALQPMRLN